jgi:hypothetical protein
LHMIIAQLPAVAVSSGHIVHIYFIFVICPTNTATKPNLS